MVTVNIFNLHPIGKRYTDNEVKEWIGQDFPLSFRGEIIGHVTVIDADADNAGVSLTYETAGIVGLSILVPTPKHKE